MRARLLNARTPNEVFFDRAIRVPHRVPDESFAYLFFDLVEGGRIVGNNGVQCEKRIYRLQSLECHLRYWGERVDVRLNPDDQTGAMIYDRRTGEFVCRARADLHDATYDTRDDVTRALIARVFSDGKHLLRMAKAVVEGSSDRLAEYRRAKIEYLVRRVREMERARANVPTPPPAATVIGRHTANARKADGAPRELLSAEAVLAVLDADAATPATAPAEIVAPAGPAPHVAPAGTCAADTVEPATTPLCVVSKRRRAPKAPPAHRRRPGALSYRQIATRIGISLSSLSRFRSGADPWPEGLEAQFHHYADLRVTAIEDPVLPPPPARATRTRVDEPTLSYAGIAQALGISRETLRRYRRGMAPWPDGMLAAFEACEQRRTRYP